MSVPVSIGMIPPDLTDLLLTHAKGLWVIIWYQYKASAFVDTSSMAPGQQVRLHIRRGGYQP